MLLELLLLLLAVPTSACDAAHAGPELDGAHVSLTGLLVIGGHTASLVEPGKSPDCSVFPIFSGTPVFEIPDISEKGLMNTPRINRFLDGYLEHLRTNRGHVRLVTFRGILKVRPSLTVDDRLNRGDGYGHRGLWRVGLIVQDIEDVTCVEPSTWIRWRTSGQLWHSGY